MKCRLKEEGRLKMRRAIAMLMVAFLLVGCGAEASNLIKTAQNLCFDGKTPLVKVVKAHPEIIQNTVEWSEIGFYDGSMGAKLRFQCKGDDWFGSVSTVWYDVSIKIMADGKTGMITYVEKSNPLNAAVMQKAIVDDFVSALSGKGNLVQVNVEMNWEYSY